jgi:hypothetical protein
MIPEEMESTMQFILEQQAQLTVMQAKAEERAEKDKEYMAESDERIARIEAIQENTARQIEHLGRALVELTEAHTRTQDALTRLAEAQAYSDGRLDALIDVVRGGKDKGR